MVVKESLILEGSVRVNFYSEKFSYAGKIIPFQKPLSKENKYL
jgi:hypothetical protein